jgi:hypothetical protein
MKLHPQCQSVVKNDLSVGIGLLLLTQVLGLYWITLGLIEIWKPSIREAMKKTKVTVTFNATTSWDR